MSFIRLSEAFAMGGLSETGVSVHEPLHERGIAAPQCGHSFQCILHKNQSQKRCAHDLTSSARDGDSHGADIRTVCRRSG